MVSIFVPRSKKISLFILKILVTSGLLWFLADQVQVSEMMKLIARAEFTGVLVAFLLLLLQACLAALRWHKLMIFKQIDLYLRKSAAYFWLGLFFNQVLPSSIGGDAVRGYCVVRENHSLGRVMLSVILDRILGMIGLLALISLTIPYALQLIAAEDAKWGLLIAFSVLIVVISAIFFLDYFLARLIKWRIAKGLAALAFDIRALFRKPLGWVSLLISMVIHVLSIAAVWMLSLSLDLPLHWQALAVVVPVATLVATIPVSIAGWGVREGVMVIGLGFAKVMPEQALALSILYGLSLIVASLPGAFVWFWSSGKGHKNMDRTALENIRDV